MPGNVELRINQQGTRLCERGSDCPLQEDFENGCMRCPLTGRVVKVSDIITVLRQGLPNTMLLLQTLHEAAGGA